jgi:hypothetical protein
VKERLESRRITMIGRKNKSGRKLMAKRREEIKVRKE